MGLSSFIAIAGVVGHYLTGNDWIIAGAVLTDAALLFIGGHLPPAPAA